MTRAWLTEWEWACCGDPFGVGDEVDLGLSAREADPHLQALLGAELASTVDAVESHHEQDFPDRLKGRVAAVHAVTIEVLERRSLRRPGHGAPPDAVMPAEGEEWPMTGRDLGNGLFIGSRPTRYMIEASDVPATAEIHSVPGVRIARDTGGWSPAPVEPVEDPPEERRTRRQIGWLVDVED